ncbi:MAG: hypothetical protein MK105_16550 [Crocinitomicaceae bacterium]|nr:hypothetical protein [Crocinitomicaceae bacterium]
MSKIILIILVSLFFVQCNSDSAEVKFEKLTEFLEPKEQGFEIDPTKDTLIECESGTLLFFGANSIIIEDGSEPEGNISIEVQEFYSMKDFISNDLQTTSDTSLLVSGGMVKISAFNDGKKCNLKKDKPYSIFFPKDNNENMDMKTFYAKENNSNINWKLMPPTMSDIDSTEQKDTVTTLLRCKVGFDETYGIGFSGITNSESENKNYKPADEIYEYAEKHFKPTDEMTKELCENSDLFVNVSIEFSQDGSIENVRSYGDTTRFDDYVINFFDTITKRFGDENHHEELFVLFHLSGQERPTTENFTYSFNNKYSEFRNKAISKVDKAEFNYYVQNSISFGLINCDYFFKTDSKKVDYFVDSNKSGKVYLIFDQYKSMMIEQTNKNGRYTFANVPEGMAVKIISISYEKDNPEMCIEQTTTSNKAFGLKNFQEFTLEELNLELTKI